MTDVAAWLFPLSGALLLALLALDVFQTAFHAEGRGGPINRRQNRVIWKLVRWTATVGGRRSGPLLSLGGPLMAVTTIAVWSLLLLAGFTLIYMPYILDFHFSTGSPGPATLEAFYYSGMVAATLGQGDVVARGAALRVVTIIQAVAGFALVTVAVTYVLAVYRELIASQSLAEALDAWLADGPEASPPEPGTDPEWDRSITLRLSHVLVSHFNYPILHYFRPTQRSRALPPQMEKLLAGLRLRQTQGGGEGGGGHSATSSHRALEAMVDRYIAEVHSLFVRQEPKPDEDTNRDTLRLRQILSMMAYERTE